MLRDPSSVTMLSVAPVSEGTVDVRGFAGVVLAVLVMLLLSNVGAVIASVDFLIDANSVTPRVTSTEGVLDIC